MNLRSAFTLIELLVVVAVIAILASLLFPAISVAKAKTRRTICMNNLSQIALGVRMYSDDSNDISPKNQVTTNTAPLNWGGYKKLMKTYVGLNGASSPGDKLFACPADIFYYDIYSAGAEFFSKSLHDQAWFDYSSYLFNGGNQYNKSLTRSPAGPGLVLLDARSRRSKSRPELFSWQSTRPISRFPGMSPDE
jgi:prepilin-type N-terminal cleavage/methylation domain-containing protein